jgi:23S rRNA (uracil1939-C5)-methyltransferase
VPLTLPGEQARVRITQRNPPTRRPRPRRFFVASPERIAPACPHFGACGGCHYQHANYASQLSFKQTILRETLLRGGVDVPDEIAVLSGKDWGYRNRIRLALDCGGKSRLSRSPFARRRSRSGSAPSPRRCWWRPRWLAPRLHVAVCPRAAPHRNFALLQSPESALLLAVFTPEGHCQTMRFEDFAQALAERIPALNRRGVGGRGHFGFVVPEQQPRFARPVGRGLARSTAPPDFDYRVDHGAFFQVNRWLVDSWSRTS